MGVSGVLGLLAERLSSFSNAYQKAVGPKGLLLPKYNFLRGFLGGACHTHRRGCGLIVILKHLAGYNDSSIYGFVV